MPDTARTSTDLLTNLFQDGQADGAITAQDVRDLIVSLRPAFMGLYVTSSAETVIASQSAFVKMAGTTAVTNKTADMDDASSTSNRLRYTGTPTRHFHVVGQASLLLASGSNVDVAISIWHFDASAGSGALITAAEARTTIPGADVVEITTTADVAMDTNDYLEIHLANNTNTTNLTAQKAYLYAQGIMT